MPERPLAPIFAIGTGRSGTTLFFDLLRRHRDLAWPCQFMVGEGKNHRDRWTERLARVPAVGAPLSRWHRHRRPVPEPYGLWSRYAAGFARPCRDLEAHDAPAAAVDQLPEAVALQQRRMRKPRFFSKYTGWSRIGFVDAVFPDARYVHVVRDGRAVAASLLSVSWWHGWGGPAQWRWGPLPAADQQRWEESGGSFYVLAGLQWKLLMHNLTSRGATVGARYLQVRYEDLVAAPHATLQRVVDWAGLDPDPDLAPAIDRVALRDANHKWREQVPATERAAFERLLGDELVRFGYAADSATRAP
ncbi:MAG: sulfotransferase [Planctomycetota bacterium]